MQTGKSRQGVGHPAHHGWQRTNVSAVVTQVPAHATLRPCSFAFAFAHVHTRAHARTFPSLQTVPAQTAASLDGATRPRRPQSAGQCWGGGSIAMPRPLFVAPTAHARAPETREQCRIPQHTPRDGGPVSHGRARQEPHTCFSGTSSDTQRTTYLDHTGLPMQFSRVSCAVRPRPGSAAVNVHILLGHNFVDGYHETWCHGRQLLFCNILFLETTTHTYLLLPKGKPLLPLCPRLSSDANPKTQDKASATCRVTRGATLCHHTAPPRAAHTPPR